MLLHECVQQVFVGIAYQECPTVQFITVSKLETLSFSERGEELGIGIVNELLNNLRSSLDLELRMEGDCSYLVEFSCFEKLEVLLLLVSTSINFFRNSRISEA